MIMARVGETKFRKSSTIRALVPLRNEAARCLLHFLTEKEEYNSAICPNLGKDMTLL